LGNSEVSKKKGLIPPAKISREVPLKMEKGLKIPENLEKGG